MYVLLPFPPPSQLYLLTGRLVPGWFVKPVGNMRLQEMMGIMASERGGKLYATDERCALPLPPPLSPLLLSTKLPLET